MKLVIFQLIVYTSLHFSLCAQSDITTSKEASNFTYRLQQLGGKIQSGDMISGFSSYRAPDVIGDVYWDKHWGESSILLFKDSNAIEGYLTRYDIQKNEFEFNLSGDVKVIRGELVKDIVWMDSVYRIKRYLINGKEFSYEGSKLSGFLELLVEGQFSLYKRILIEVLKPDFNPALNVGSKDVRIIKRISYYYGVDTELNRISGRKSLEGISTSKGKTDELNDFIKKNGIRFNREDDLIRLFNAANAN